MGIQMFTRISKAVFGALVIVSCIVVPAAAGDDVAEDAASAGFQLLEEYINPRFIGMGTAGTALSGKGFSFYNPASPFLAGSTYLSVEYGLYPKADLKHAQLEGVLYLPEWFFGISLHSESIDDIYETNFWGNLPYYDAPFSYQFINVSVNAGFTRWEDIAFAVCVNGTQDRIHDEYAYAVSVSAGALYRPIVDRLTVGLSLLYAGVSTPMIGSDTKGAWGEGEDLPMNTRLGAAWSDRIRDIPYTLALDVVYRNVRDRNAGFTRRMQDRFSVPVGLEVQPVAPLFIRMGKRFNHPTEMVTFGMGLKLSTLSFDASFVVPRLVDDSQLKWLGCITYNLKTGRDSKAVKKIQVKKPALVTPAEPTPAVSPVKTEEPAAVKAAPPVIESDSAAVLQNTKKEPLPGVSPKTETVTADTIPPLNTGKPADTTPVQNQQILPVDENMFWDDAEPSDLPPDTTKTPLVPENE